MSLVAKRLGVVLLAAALVFPLASGAGASTKAKLRWAERHLKVLEQDIRDARDQLSFVRGQIKEQRQKLDALQQVMNALAAKLSDVQGKYEHTRQQIHDIHTQLVAARKRYQNVRDRIDQRARDLFMQGPGSGIEFILGATSIADLTDRVEFVTSLEAQDSDLANEVQNLASQLEIKQGQLELLRQRQADLLQELRERQAELNARYHEQTGLLAAFADKESEAEGLITSLADRQDRIEGLVAKYKRIAAAERARALAAARAAANDVSRGTGSGGGDGPFSYCPVPGSGYSDSFGAPRYAGGYHPHAGNDMFAPRNAPIVAPFSGYAYADPNGLGGNAVIVKGSAGWVYNAHLDHYGSLGSVSAGTVIGYVGNSGDAQGGATHDHFEWHPDSIPSDLHVSPYGYSIIGDAIDPWPFLNQVCS